MKVAVYTRVSTADQTSDNQRHELLAYCDRAGYDVVEYSDTASGSRSDRKAFNQMFEDARLKHFDLVLFWSLDRFSREGILPTLQYLQKLDSYEIQWRSLQEQYLDSTGPFRDAVIGIMASLARQERIRISERTKAGLARARRQGKKLGRPTGIVNKNRIEHLAAEGLSQRKIAAKLGYSKGTVQRVLEAAA
jgi:DNA invertase Pin-like site-specific DNA recombinase